MFTHKHNIDKNTAYLTQILPCPIIPNTARYHHSPTYQTSALPTAYFAMAADLTHATLVRNPEYERNGLKSYVRALQKYGITPTVPGPYCLASKPESDVQGTFTDHSGKILTQEFQLVKRDAETAHAGTVPVRLTDPERTAVDTYGLILTSKSGRGRRTQLPVPCRSRHRHSAAAHQAELRHRIRRYMGVEHPPPRRCQRWETPPLRPQEVLHLERS
jgi:hypothetical protein